jgi:hypothetical protein
MTIFDQSYPPSLWATPPGRAATAAPANSYELPGDVEHFTIPQVQEWVGAHPDQRADVLAAEEARGEAARSTLVDWLNAQEAPA